MLIALATDFGSTGPYMGQMRAVLATAAPGVAVIDLFSDLPAFEPKLAAYALAAHLGPLPPDSVVIGVVDPGVGGERRAVALRVDGRWLVGPDNGLFAPLVRRGLTTEAWTLACPPQASASFHGRDVFAPAAGALARGDRSGLVAAIDPASLDRPDWPDDLPHIVYIDSYGNAMTGLRASKYPGTGVIKVGERPIKRARTFGDVAPGSAFFYTNANGLLEIAVSRGRADQRLGLQLGSPVLVQAAALENDPAP
ncbi:SAM hydrolase/SAM-dependent halogenase family protein [Rhodospirillum rubrum]|uniref:SAM-dependent chlorinase/fluorinase n=1 Tax=Rhodospirillum rubrum (strain ATCC 11170 / ATH 1.1.1 / DSM 467 / LMG 4362 / NCIMB 8255 / S1) TaxID=269796 RepID=Q2RTD3_RHORT|nr:SAM-dependent chlorinase/fluorinase [Rhodospirillum rubrum]ABC22612.1 Protein of unknown function DUF62 [Rhodospirillum rubrum ATCC 11170]MBK5954200.1 hypothetical protein [Rhodospirillum rubrum]HCF19299.1 hypothetical protein [Rhodospirillum rubrum]